MSLTNLLLISSLLDHYIPGDGVANAVPEDSRPPPPSTEVLAPKKPSPLTWFSICLNPSSFSWDRNLEGIYCNLKKAASAYIYVNERRNLRGNLKAAILGLELQPSMFRLAYILCQNSHGCIRNQIIIRPNPCWQKTKNWPNFRKETNNWRHQERKQCMIFP